LFRQLAAWENSQFATNADCRHGSTDGGALPAPGDEAALAVQWHSRPALEMFEERAAARALGKPHRHRLAALALDVVPHD
jgi:hypothetical protein